VNLDVAWIPGSAASIRPVGPPPTMITSGFTSRG
jgi:hypothetical protein